MIIGVVVDNEDCAVVVSIDKVVVIIAIVVVGIVDDVVENVVGSCVVTF